MRVYDGNGTATSVDFQAYGAGQWGTNVSSGDINGGSTWEILAGPGPGAVYGPQMRAFARDGTPLAKVNFYAYGTLRYGVNPAAGLLDTDTFHEMVSGSGPGSAFGPHVRGWNFDSVTLAPIQKINFFAYSTLKYGVNVEDGNVDGDLFGEILTGPGPGIVFGPQVRGWNYDAVTLAAIQKINFSPAYTRSEYGVVVAGGDVDGDGFAEIATAPGPSPGMSSHFLGFDFDGGPIAPLSGFDITLFSSSYGGRLGLGDLTADGSWDLIVAAGTDPAADSTVEGYSYNGISMTLIPTPFIPFQSAGYGYGANVSAGNLGW